jgi:hypothetical protein
LGRLLSLTVAKRVEVLTHFSECRACLEFAFDAQETPGSNSFNHPRFVAGAG